MKIARIEVARRRGRIRGVAASASVRWESRESVLIRLTDSDGCLGLGEAAPLPGFSTDGIDDAQASLEALDVHAFDSVEPLELLRSARRWHRGPASAAFAVETAILDLLARRRSVPAWSLLSRSSNATARRVPLSVLVSDGIDLERAMDRGIRTVKIKVGAGSIESGVDLCRTASKTMRVVIDANQTWSVDVARKALVRFASAGAAYVEEPVEPDDLARLDASPVALALDETLADPGRWPLAERAIESGIVSTLILKPTVLGGIVRCMDLIDLARARDLQVSLSHAFDGPIALASAAACAVTAVDVACSAGLDRHAGLTAWPASPLPMLDAAHVRAWSEPGLGVDCPMEPT